MLDISHFESGLAMVQAKRQDSHEAMKAFPEIDRLKATLDQHRPLDPAIVRKLIGSTTQQMKASGTPDSFQIR